MFDADTLTAARKRNERPSELGQIIGRGGPQKFPPVYPTHPLTGEVIALDMDADQVRIEWADGGKGWHSRQCVHVI